jgi:hypothetical protein
MKISEEYDNFLSASGFPLNALGLREIALSRGNALQAVRILRRVGKPILGGDAYLRLGERIESTFANWYTDPKSSEERQSFLLRSWESAEAFLNSYPEPDQGEPMFTIVVGDLGL